VPTQYGAPVEKVPSEWDQVADPGAAVVRARPVELAPYGPALDQLEHGLGCRGTTGFVIECLIHGLRLVSPCTQRIDRLIDLLEQIRDGGRPPPRGSA
jgi:hypothetical protein